MWIIYMSMLLVGSKITENNRKPLNRNGVNNIRVDR